MSKGRLETFSDGVIAIIITIMVLELRAPHGTDWSILRPLMPVLPQLCARASSTSASTGTTTTTCCTPPGKISGGVLWSNMHLLFWLSLVPFVTAWMGENAFASNPVALYGVVLLMAALAYALLVRVLLKHHEADSPLARAIGSDAKGNISVLLYVIGIVSSWIHPRSLAGVLCDGNRDLARARSPDRESPEAILTGPTQFTIQNSANCRPGAWSPEPEPGALSVSRPRVVIPDVHRVRRGACGPAGSPGRGAAGRGRAPPSAP